MRACRWKDFYENIIIPQGEFVWIKSESVTPSIGSNFYPTGKVRADSESKPKLRVQTKVENGEFYLPCFAQPHSSPGSLCRRWLPERVQRCSCVHAITVGTKLGHGPPRFSAIYSIILLLCIQGPRPNRQHSVRYTLSVARLSESRPLERIHSHGDGRSLAIAMSSNLDRETRGDRGNWCSRSITRGSSAAPPPAARGWPRPPAECPAASKWGCDLITPSSLISLSIIYFHLFP
jgi:hypothetical protein